MCSSVFMCESVIVMCMRKNMNLELPAQLVHEFFLSILARHLFLKLAVLIRVKNSFLKLGDNTFAVE